MSDLGTEIRDARMARNMSQKVLSTETKTLQEQINAMENGRPGFSKEKLKVVLDYLGIKAHPVQINKYYDECHLGERVMKCTVLPAPEKEDEETSETNEALSDDANELIKEVEVLKLEIEAWLKTEYKGVKGWIGAVDAGRKLFTKVLKII